MQFIVRCFYLPPILVTTTVEHFIKIATNASYPTDKFAIKTV